MADMLVVGGAGGVGFEVLKKLVAREERVVTTVLNQTEASRVSTAFGQKVTVHDVDLGDPDAALAKLRTLVGAIPSLSGVAVCAAISRNGPLELAPLSDLRLMLEVNCLANIAVYQAVLPALRKSRGTLVMISSVSGKIGLPLVGGYTASKFALEGAADVMRREAAEQGVKVCLVEPGGIRTSMIPDQIEADKARLAALSEAQRQLYGHLFERFRTVAGGSIADKGSTPEEVASVVIAALDAATPEPRYAAGGDAQQMLDLIKPMADRDIDLMVAQMFSKSASSGWAEDRAVK